MTGEHDVRRVLDGLLTIPKAYRTRQDRDDIRTLLRALEILTGSHPKLKTGRKQRPVCVLQDRAAWLLHTRGRLTYEQVGERLGVSKERVRQLLYRYERTALPGS